MIADFVRQVDAKQRPGAWVRHYSFVDFEKYGSFWTPTYINMVRDPVERVRTRTLNILFCNNLEALFFDR